MIKRLLPIVALFLAAPVLATAAGHGPKLEAANVSLGNKATLQRGARLFVNYCVSCHSAAFMRYSRIAEDLDLSAEMVETNLMFTTDKIGDGMSIAMRPADAAEWFGIAPPDLSVIARSRGADWLYNFLLGFYLDDARPTGVNNTIFQDTAMPHPLWELQGLQRAVYTTETDEHGAERTVLEGFELEVPGELSAEEYKEAVRDLVSFLVYVGEPAKLVRYRVGLWVIAFLFVLGIPAYLLKVEYWKDVH